MNYLLDMLQGAGLGSASGIRPFLAGLLSGLLARADAGVDYEGTSFAFLESSGFLFALLLALLVVVLLQRRGAVPETTIDAAVAGIGIGLGALLGAGSVDDRHEVWWPGLLAGAACALLGSAVARSLFARTRARLDAEARAALPMYAEGAALVIAGLSVLFPPLAVVAVGLLAWLLVGGRRREGEKYAGLRILR